MLGDKFRFRFRKSGVLRLLSHHDLMRCCERMLRRAEIPFRSTGGFHPTPRLVFALSLPLGIEGLREVVELETIRELPADDVFARLSKQAPEGLQFLDCKVIPIKSNAVPRRAIYQVEVLPSELALAEERIPDLLSQPKLWVERLRPKPRRLNIRPYVRNVSLNGNMLDIDLWVTQNGTGKAEEILKLLTLNETFNSGQLVQRTDLEIHDEILPSSQDAPPTEPPEHAILEHVPTSGENEETVSTEPQSWGLSPNGPVVE